MLALLHKKGNDFSVLLLSVHPVWTKAGWKRFPSGVTSNGFEEGDAAIRREEWLHPVGLERVAFFCFLSRASLPFQWTIWRRRRRGRKRLCNFVSPLESIPISFFLFFYFYRKDIEWAAGRRREINRCRCWLNNNNKRKTSPLSKKWPETLSNWLAPMIYRSHAEVIPTSLADILSDPHSKNTFLAGTKWDS